MDRVNDPVSFSHDLQLVRYGFKRRFEWVKRNLESSIQHPDKIKGGVQDLPPELQIAKARTMKNLDKIPA